MTRTEQYLEEAQSFLDKGHFTEAEKERLSVLRDRALIELQAKQLKQAEAQTLYLEEWVIKAGGMV